VRALVFHGPHRLSWDDVPDARPGAGEAVVAIRAAGICGSDVHGFSGASGRRRAPMVMGHELAGEVVEVGPAGDRATLGRRVVVQPFLACGSCAYCRAGGENLCRERQFLGATRDGGMAERLAVPVANLLPCDASLPYAHAALTEPLAVAIHAVRQAGEVAGRSALVAGCGAIGLLTLAVLRARGAGPIICTDLLAERRSIALALGANAASDGMGDLETSLARLTHGVPEVDVAFDAAGIEATLSQAVGAVRPGGTVIAIGGWRTAPLDLPRLVGREITLRGSFNFLAGEFAEAKAWLEACRVPAARLVTGLHPMRAGPDVFRRLADGPGADIKSVLMNEA
jgi:L-iditol 2-dehydrogenase